MNLANFFNQQQFDQYVAYLKSTGLSTSSIQRKLSSIATFQKFLIKKNIIAPTPKNTLQINISKDIVPLKNKIKNIFSKSTINDLRSKPLTQYLLIASLLIIVSGIGVTLYRQAITKAKKNLAYTTSSTPVYANRFLSFQGRLTDSAGNPITSSTGIVFELYNTENVGTGTSLYSSAIGNSQVVTPDENGIFAVTIGKTHGTEIPNSVFTENPAVFLQITAGGEVMDPRQPIATVAYAVNSESLQGLPPSASGLKNTVLVIDGNGNLNLGETSPTIKSTSGTLGIEGQAILLTASNGSGGDIEINPDASGIIKLTTEGNGSTAVGGFIDATNANLSTGNLYSGTIRNTNRGYNFLSFRNYNIGTTQLSTRFSVDAYGNTYIGGTLSPTNISIGNTLLTSSAYELNLLDGLLPTNGSIIYGNGSRLANSSVGVSGQLLMSNGSGTPTWINASSVGTTYSANNGLSLVGNQFRLGGLLSQNTDIGFSGFNLTFSDGGTTFASFSAAGNTFYNPTSFTSAGDVSIAYDLNFTNSSSSTIRSSSPLYIQTESPYANLDINLTAANSGKIYLNSNSEITKNLNVGQSLTVVGNGSFAGNLSTTKNLTVGGTFVSVGSSNLVTNLNADLLDGLHASNFLQVGNSGAFTYTSSAGITQVGNDFRLNLAYSPVWTGLHTFTNGIGVTGTTNLSGNLNVGGTGYFASYLGINTNTPTAPLDIKTGSGFTRGLRIGPQNTTVNDGSYIEFTSSSVDNYGAQIGGIRDGGASGSNNALVLRTANTENMRISSSGNIGIGTTNPTHKLEVIGDAYFSTNLTIGGTFVSVGSTNLVSNLNADLLDGLHSSSFLQSADLANYVQGPASATDNAIARFNGTTGKIIQNTGVTIDDSNNLTTAGIGNFATINTGLGNNELYAMNQNVRTTDSPTFGGLTLNGNLTLGSHTLTTTNTGLVTNLNADLLDGQHSTYFLNIGQTGSLPYVNNTTNGTLTRSGSGPYTLGLNLANANTWTGNQTFNTTTYFNSDISGSFSNTVIRNASIDTHPEGSTVLIPFINNDLAYISRQGGTISDNYGSSTSTLEGLIDGKPNYVGYTVASIPPEGYILTINFGRNFNWGSKLGLSFGASGWKSGYVKIEVYSNTAAGWVTAYENSSNISNQINTSYGSDGSGISQVRFTFNNFGSSFRLSEVWLQNYSSPGVSATHLNRGGDSMYGNIYPNTNDSYSLGTSSYRWGDYYGVDGNLSGNLSVGGTLTLPQGAGAGKILQSDASGNASWITASGVGGTDTWSAGGGISITSAGVGRTISVNYDATLDLNGSQISLNTGNANTWTGTQTFGTATYLTDYGAAGSINLRVGDDSYLTDVDAANTLGIYGVQSTAVASIRLGSNSSSTISGYNGYIGIGTTTPTSKLHVIGNGTFSTSLSVGTTLTAATINFTNSQSTTKVTNLNADLLDGLHSSSFLQVGSTGSFIYTASNGITQVGNDFQLNLAYTPVWTGLHTFTSGIGVTGTTNLTNALNVGGTAYFGSYVGIGTINPNAKLTTVQTNMSDGYGFIFGIDSGNTYANNRIRVGIGNTNWSGMIDLYNSGDTLTTRIKASGSSFFNGGNVGIGTTSPSHKLDVVGDAYFSTNLNIGGTFLSVGSTNLVSNLNADLLDGYNSSNFTTHNEVTDLGTVTINDGTTATTIITSQFITILEDLGAFDNYHTVMKASWSYAGNDDITDTGFGTLDPAGSVIETWTDDSSDITRGNITVRVTRPTTGSGGSQILVYNDQGSTYSPGWRQIWNSSTDGSGSTLDADLLDGYHASSFGKLNSINTWTALQTFTNGIGVTGNSAFSGNVGIGTTASATSGNLLSVGNYIKANNVGQLYASSLIDSEDNTAFLDAANSSATKASLSLYATGSIRYNTSTSNNHLVTGAASRIQNYSNGLLFGVSSSTTGSISGWDNDLFLNSNGGIGIGTTSPTQELTVNGDLNLTGQIQLGTATTNPTAIGTGAMYYNSDATAIRYYDGANWLQLAVNTFFTSTGTVPNTSYLEIEHNQNTTNLVATGWEWDPDSSTWKLFDGTSEQNQIIDLMEYSGDSLAQTAYAQSDLPDFTYSGTYTTIDDGLGNWRIKFLTSGTLVVSEGINIDTFLVGGGAGGSRGDATYQGAGGGGGGYTATYTNIPLTAGTNYSVVVGMGGSGATSYNTIGGSGVTSYFANSGTYYANGGSGGTAWYSGGNGGSGGGYGQTSTGNGPAGASNGGSVSGGGTGQGTTTKEFGESTGTLYSGGGGGGGYRTYGGGAGGGGGGGASIWTGSVSGTTNLGGGGGASMMGSTPGNGGSGIVIIRNKDRHLPVYSESTIKQEGSYSLKGVATATTSLNETLIHYFSPTINLTNQNKISFDLRSSRTGKNIKLSFRDSGGVVTEVTPNITVANQFQNFELDISGVDNSNKDSIDKLTVTIVDANADNTFYVDNITTVNDYRITQIDSNTVRLYNYSGATKNLKLDIVTDRGGSSDGGSGGSSSGIWSDLVNPTADLSLNMGNYSSTFNWTGGGKFSMNSLGNIGIGITASSTSGNLLSVGNYIKANNVGQLYASSLIDSEDNTAFLDAANSSATAASLSLYATGSIRYNTSSSNTHLVTGAASRIQNYSNGLLLGVSSSTTGSITGWDSNLFLNSNGGIGIGTTNPSGKFQIDIGNTRAFTVANNGFIGIGTTSPTRPLQILSIGNTNSIFSASIGTSLGIGMGIGNTLSGLQFMNYGTGHMGLSSNGSNIFIDAASNGANPDTWGSHLVTFASSGNVGIGTTNPLFKLQIAGDITYPNDISTGNAQFSITGASDPTKRLNIGYDTNSGNGFGFIAAGKQGTAWTNLNLQPSGGNVGIGTTNPLGRLNINDGGNSHLLLGDNATTGKSYLSLYLSAASSGYAVLQAVSANGSAFGNINMNPSGGNVGIGTTNPAYKLSFGSPTNGTKSIALWENGASSGFYGFGNNTNRLEIFAGNSNGDPARMVINYSGNVGIGMIDPTYKLQVNGNAANTTGVWTNYSDIRLKNSITSIDNSLKTILQLDPVYFNWNDPNKNAEYGRVRGFIAQDVEKVVPEWVVTDSTGYKALQTIGMDAMLVGSIKELNAKVEILKSDLTLTSTGQININYNISDEVLTSLGYSDSKNEIESATYNLTDSTGNIVSRISQFQEIASAKIKAGLISVKNIIADNIVTKNLVSQKVTTDNIISPLGNIDHLTTQDIQSTNVETENLVAQNVQTTQVTTDDLVADNATISGTLYADNIISKEGSIGDLMTNKISSLREELQKLVAKNEATPSALLAESNSWYSDIASDSATIHGDLNLSDNLIVGNQLIVNGNTQLGNTFINGIFNVGDIAIKDNLIETTNTALYIQPSQTGSVHIMGDTLVIADNGNVTINGNLSITGSFAARNIIADEITTNKLTAVESTINDLSSTKLNIATDSASTIIASDTDINIATSSAKVNSNATAGTATLPAGKTELIISTNKITPESMVYLTPLASTQNQVLYVKSKDTSSFTISLDNPLTNDIQINWWIIN